MKMNGVRAASDASTSKQGEKIMELFTKLNKDATTFIQVTRSEKNAAYGSRIVKLPDGRVM